MNADRKGWILVPPPREDDDVSFVPSWRRRRVNGFVPFLLLATAVAIPAGSWYWWSSRHTMAPLVAASSAPPAPAPSPATDSNAPPPVPNPAPPSSAPVAAVPADSAVPTRKPEAARRPIVDSSAILEEQRLDQAEADREAAEALALEQRRQAAQRTSDSIAADRRVTDSITAARAAEDQATQDEADRRASEARLASEATATAAATAARTHEAHLAAGKAALSDWLNALVTAVNTAKFGDPALTIGPPDFGAFAFKRHPTLTGATITAMTVTDNTGDATVEWVARWKSPFGTASSRKMKAAATAVRAGETWLVRNWNLTEGAP